MTDHRKRILACGGRDSWDRKRVFEVLDKLNVAEVIHGGARGADMLSDTWARAKGIPVKVYHPNWKEYGLAAGPIRNNEMLQEKPDLVVAFPGQRGTKDMTQKALAAGIPVMTIEE